MSSVKKAAAKLTAAEGHAASFKGVGTSDDPAVGDPSLRPTPTIIGALAAQAHAHAAASVAAGGGFEPIPVMVARSSAGSRGSGRASSRGRSPGSPLATATIPDTTE